jgi:flagellar biosynthesis/type III secretory pathway M-ring protein FliF/YscJ
MMIGGGVGAAVLLAGIGFLVFKMMKKSPPPAQPRAADSLPPAGADQAAAPRVAGTDSWAPSGLSASGSMPALAPARIEVLTNQIRETAQKDGELCAGVLRGWLREEQA